MSRSLPISVVRAMMKQSTDAQPLFLLRIYDATASIRIVNDTQDVIGPDGETYKAAPFAIDLPADEDAGVPIAQVQIRDVERQVVKEIKRTSGLHTGLKADTTVIQRGVLKVNSTSHLPLLELVGYDLLGADDDDPLLTFSLSIASILDAPLAKKTFSPGHFPGVH